MHPLYKEKRTKWETGGALGQRVEVSDAVNLSSSIYPKGK